MNRHTAVAFNQPRYLGDLAFKVITIQDIIYGSIVDIPSNYNFTIRFKYCPFTGEKINWKRLRKVHNYIIERRFRNERDLILESKQIENKNRLIFLETKLQELKNEIKKIKTR